MSQANRRLSHAMAGYIKKMARVPATGTRGINTFVCTWIGAEVEDASLSQILLPGGAMARYVPKGGHVTGLTAGDPVVVQSAGSSGSYTIVMKLAGDASIAATLSIEPDSMAPGPPTSVFVNTPTSESLNVHWTDVTDASGIAGYDVYFSNGTYARTQRPGLGAIAIHNLQPATSYSFYVRARDRFGNVSGNSAVASGTTAAAATSPPGTTFTLNYPAIWSGSYNYNNLSEYDAFMSGQCNQGRGRGGNTVSLIGFDYAKIISDCSGGTPINVWATLTYASWWNRSGTAVIGYHGAPSRPNSLAGVPGYVPNWTQSVAWPRGTRRAVALGSGVCSLFMLGSARGIVLGPGPSTDVIYSGYAYGVLTGIHQPVLTIQFKR